MARGRKTSASRSRGSRKLTSATFLLPALLAPLVVGELDVRHAHLLEHVVEHAIGVDAGGQRLVRQHEPVAQHVARDVADVRRQHVVAPAQQRQRAARVHEVDRAARAGAELDPVLLARIARGGGQLDRVLHDAPVDEHRVGGALVARERLRGEHLADLGGRYERALDDGDLVAVVRVADHELEHEAVDLRLGQRVGALGLDRVLRRQHEEGQRHVVGVVADRDLALLHHLEQGGLHLGGRAVDLVGEQEVAEHRAELGVEAAGVLAVDARADEVRRHEVGRELEPLERAAERVGERLHGQRLGEARDALEQHVAPGQERDEQPLEHRLLPDDHALDLEHRGLERGVGLPRRIGGSLVDRVQAVVVRHAIRVRGSAHWTGVFGRLPSFTVTVRLFPSRLSSTLTSSPGRLVSTVSERSEGLRIALPPMAVMTSPPRMPAFSAGEPFVTVPTTAPGESGCSALERPSHARSILPFLISFGTTSLTVSDGTAKPTPELEPLCDAICELMPITRPAASSSGPPELPGLMAASVCTAPGIEKPLGASISRPSAETMPVVTVPERPNGEPIAIAASPGRSELEEASCSGLVSLDSCLGSMASTARSLEGSLPTSLAGIGSPFSPKRTVNLSASSTTWSLVTMWPSVSITKPEPEAAFPPPWPLNWSWPLPPRAETKTTLPETRA